MSVIISGNVHSGIPTIEGTRIPVSIVLSYFADGDTIEAILGDFPRLQKDDVLSALRFAAHVMDRPFDPISNLPKEGRI